MSETKPTAEYNGSEIAIIGMSCRIPQANNIEDFWENLKNGVESIAILPHDAIETSDLDPADINDASYIKAASTLENIEMFDASFFNYTPREAETMDPQHRLFLECAWEALESAGYDSDAYPHSIGVFAGARTNTYLYNLVSNPNLVKQLGSFQIGLENDLSFLSTRVSHKLNLRGPSYSLQTACSTSLAAVHLACQSLLIDECQMALAGGVAINVPHKTGYLYQPNGILSPDGHCRPFDADAQGTIFGSGVGVVLLKRLEDALSDGDFIYAVIKGSAVNNDGGFKASFTAPSVQGQVKVIMEALASADVGAETINYIETHGTATPMGDLIEFRALSKAYENASPQKQYCAIGSLKSNIGHLDAAAGIASLIKTALSLWRQYLPPSLHFKKPNPQIDFTNSPFYVNAELSAWRKTATPRRAGVSAFGVGGTNAHVILEEFQGTKPAGETGSWQILPLSARTEIALENTTNNIINYLKRNPETNLPDVAYTLQVGRRGFDYRRVLICRDAMSGVQALETLDQRYVLTGYREIGDRPLVFMFPGGGAQYENMGRGLYQTQTVFREQVDECSERLISRLGFDLRKYLYPDSEDRAERFQQTSIALPALFVVEYALARLLMSWNIRPSAMIGHSLGEYVAACLADVFSLEDALSIVALRGRLFEQLPAGGMLSVPLPESEVKSLIGENLDIAANNGPASCVISGRLDQIKSMESKLKEKQIEYKNIPVKVAAHSEMVASIQPAFREYIEKITRHPPKIPFISNLTGTWITQTDAVDSEYWVKHLREKVNFGKGIGELLQDTSRLFIEVGPGQALGAMVKSHLENERVHDILPSIRHAADSRSDEAVLLNLLGALWLAGAEPDWRAIHAERGRRRLPLPTYPFERQRYWTPPAEKSTEAESRRPKTGKKPQVGDWFYIPSWKYRPLMRTKLPSSDLDSKTWLIFINGEGLGAVLANQLKEEGKTCIVVEMGQAFLQIDQETFAINPQRPTDYRLLLEAIISAGHSPTEILHLWSLASINRKSCPVSEPQYFKYVQTKGYYSLLFLAQSLENVGFTSQVRLSVVSNHLFEVGSDDVIYPEKATLLGPCKVIQQEYPNISCRCIDIDYSQSPRSAAVDVSARILNEIRSNSIDAVVAYRGNQRWVQIYEPMPLEKEAESDQIRPFRENGVYLITGGLGGVGLILAEYLAETKRAKLVLLGRSPFPKRDAWDDPLSIDGADEATHQKIRKLKRLEELGSEILVLNADVADENQMRKAIELTIEKFGSINGVLHAAGVTSGDSVFNPLLKIGQVESESQFHPKVYGTYVIEKVLKDAALDFCMLFSSNAAILGGMGFVVYSASNLFMDAFAADRTKISGFPWISANWDHWPEETRKYHGYQTSIDQYTMTVEESREAFRLIATSATQGQIVVSTGDLHDRYDLWINRNITATQRGAAGAVSGLAERSYANVRSNFVAPKNETERRISEIWANVMGIDKVGGEDNFFELGGHSLLATKIVSRISSAFQVDLPLRKFFEAPTVIDLALCVNDLQAEQSYQNDIEMLNLVAHLSDDNVEEEIKKRTAN